MTAKRRSHAAWMPVGTVRFLVTDIEGSTKLWETQHDVMQTSLARHDALLRQCIEAHGGYVVKTLGDRFLPTRANKFAPTKSVGFRRAEFIRPRRWQSDEPQPTSSRLSAARRGIK